MKAFLLLAFALISVCLLAPIIFIFRFIFFDNRKKYLNFVALGLDRLGAVIFYKKLGWTVSSLTFFRYILKEKSFNKKGFYFYFMSFINFIFNDKNHCENSYFWEIKHRQTNTKNTNLKEVL